MRSSVIAVAIVLSACSRPKPPTLRPEKAVVTSVGLTGIQMNVELAVDNPNGVDISARAVSAKVVLDGKYTLNPVTVSQAFTLAARSETKLAVPMTLPWSDISSLVSLASSNRPIPYVVDGSVNVGGESVNADLPFRLTGVLTREQLVQATLNSLPKLP